MNEVEIVVKVTDKSKGDLNKAESNVRGFGDRAGGAVKKFGQFAALGLAGAGLGLLKFGKDAVMAAGDAEQSIGGTQAVFGEFADTVIRKSKGAADAYGLSANSYRESANLIGASLKNQGVASDQLAGKTDALVKLGADLSATYGGTAKEAVEALGSAFKGEFDPLDKYGIALSAAKITTEAYAVAGVKTAAAFGKLSQAQQDQAKQQATTNLLMLQSKDAQGQSGREADTLQSKIQKAKAKFEDMSATLGSIFLPKIADVFGKVGDLAKRLEQELPAAITTFTEAYNGVDLSGGDTKIDDAGAALGDLSRALDTAGDDMDETSEKSSGFGDLWATVVANVAESAANIVRTWTTIVLGAREMSDKVALAWANMIEGIAEAGSKLPGPMGEHFRRIADDARENARKIQDRLDKINTKQAQNKIDGAIAKLHTLGRQRPSPKVNADISSAIRKIAQLSARLHNIPDQYVNVFINEVQRDNVRGGHRVGQGAKAHGGIQGAASGGARGGLTMVGEYGRELVRLPYGSQVIPNGTTEAMMSRGAGGGAQTVQLEWVGDNGDDLFRWLRKNIRIKGGNVQTVLGGQA